jgi:hypothetical protein
MCMDDPPHVNCRAAYPTPRRTISLIPISLIEGVVVKRPVFASSIGKAAAPDFSVAVFVVIQL